MTDAELIRYLKKRMGTKHPTVLLRQRHWLQLNALSNIDRSLNPHYIEQFTTVSKLALDSMLYRAERELARRVAQRITS